MISKKTYEKPSMKVVMLKQRPRLLVGSNGDGNINRMGNPEDL